MAAAPTALLVGAPAHAATTPVCSGSKENTATCYVDWKSGVLTPAKITVRVGVSVLWHNNNSTPILDGGTVTLASAKGAPTTFSVTAGTRSATKSVKFSKAGTEKYTGNDGTSGTTAGTITVAAAPTPTPTHSTASSSPKPKSTHSTTPATSPAPQPTSPPLGVTNPPPLGIGVLAPTPSPAGPGPMVAGPDDLFGAPTPTPTSVAAAPRALAQSVPARKYGLPGALAAVLLTGVVVGVVRLARLDFGNGHSGHHIGGDDTAGDNPGDNPTGPDSADEH
jgi:plastocyanin